MLQFQARESGWEGRLSTSREWKVSGTKSRAGEVAILHPRRTAESLILDKPTLNRAHGEMEIECGEVPVRRRLLIAIVASRSDVGPTRARAAPQ